MSAAVPLSRRFVSIPRAYQTEDFSLGEAWQSFAGGERANWDELLAQSRVVILADAGAGKTYELKAAARRVADQGRPAFFMRIEDIDDDFETSFEIGEPAGFRAWLGGQEEGWFFLDSVDEVRLRNPRAFENAVRKFGSKIRGARHRAHVIISSRPYAWRNTLDRALIEELLPVDPGGMKAIEEEDFESAVTLRPKDEGEGISVGLYLMAPLTDSDIRLFSHHRGVADARPFLDALTRGALMPLAQRPFDLLELLESWTANGGFGSRLEVLRSSIDHHLQITDGTTVEMRVRSARAAAEILAVASVFTGKPSFALPGEGSDTAIRVDELLPDWLPAEITGLLETGLFSEPVYGEVRFRHREIRELLAASWFAVGMADPGSRDHLRSLLFRSLYGQTNLAPRLRPIAPWLILLDERVRAEVLTHFPEVAVEGGDPASLPVEDRRRMLSALIEKVIEPSSTIDGLDNSEIARIAQGDIGDDVLVLLRRHRTNDDALFVLARLVWQGKLTACLDLMSEIALDDARGIYTRLVALRAVGSIGDWCELASLWRALNGSPAPLSRRLFSELLDHSATDGEAAELILGSIDNLEAHREFEVTGLGRAMERFIDRLPAPISACDAITPALAAGFANVLARPPHVDPTECLVSTAHTWLVPVTLQVIERLVEARHPTALSGPILGALASAATLDHWKTGSHGDRATKLREMVPTWSELNDRLFWYTVDQRRRALADGLDEDWPVTWIGHFWSFTEDSFSRTLSWIRGRVGDDRKVALSRTVRTYVESGKRPADLGALTAEVAGDPDLESALAEKLSPQPSESSEKYRKYEKDRRRKALKRDREDARLRKALSKRVKADPEAIRRPPGLKAGQLGADQFNLMRSLENEGLRSTWSDGGHWRQLIPEFGKAVAEAYGDGAMAMWKAHDPALRSDGWDGQGTSYAVIFAMAGLDFEFEDPAAVVALPSKLARRAFRYALRELNGFPKWFEPLYRARARAGLAFLWNELVWELENTRPGEPMHYVLSRLVYYGPWLHADLSPRVLDWLSSNEPATAEALDHCRAIVMGGSVDASVIANLARTKLAVDKAPEAHRPTGQAIWIDADHTSGLADLRRRLDTSGFPDQETYCTEVCVALLGRFRTVSPLFWTFRTPSGLKAFYLLTHQAIRVADDLQRADTGVYSPTARDDAQEARERLLGLLSDIPGELAYGAIRELAQVHPEPRYANFIGAKARKRAEADADLPAWTVPQVAKLARRTTPASPGTGSANAGH